MLIITNMATKLVLKAVPNKIVVRAIGMEMSDF
jgi:hypothetical protein